MTDFLLMINFDCFPKIIGAVPINPRPSFLKFRFKILDTYHRLEPKNFQYTGDNLLITDGIEGLKYLLNETQIYLIIEYKIINKIAVKWNLLRRTVIDGQIAYEAPKCTLILYDTDSKN
jgi:hypothetical protein